ncbi:MAG: anti-sigma factor [Sphingomonas sp.]|uniref:anti-sigma factor n=1 Tax=Sphingomonas sp. TaxID=28214 RepID=UPI001AC28337|nr:anti-sigma factor [Sphingomonas sp.]MBN8806765.1 anti-sigma factor [Sphingomonas sp.]
MTTEPDPDMMAAELALGVLEGDERAVALRRTLAEPEFAREVEWWRDRLGGLFDEYRPVPAPVDLVDRLDPVRPAPARRSWPILALAGALAAAIAIFFLLRPVPVVIPPAAQRSHMMMLAALAPTDRAVPPISAVVDPDSGEVRVAANDLAPSGKSAQLWMIKDGVPHAIGLLHAGSATRIVMPASDRAVLGAGIVLAVSIEPPGGSPKSTPTGPVIATGALSLS